MSNFVSYIPNTIKSKLTSLYQPFEYLMNAPKEPKIKRMYGWKKTKINDKYHYFKILQNINHIKSVDLRQYCPPIYDQGFLNSSIAHVISFAYEFDEIKYSKQNRFMPSRLFIYYNTRKSEGTINLDCGGSIKNAIQSVNSYGLCPELLYPYDITKYNIEPPSESYKFALNSVQLTYKRLNGTNINQLKQCLLEGNPFIFGFDVFESFENSDIAKTGIMPMPKPKENIVGQHCCSCVGYNDDMQAFLIRNSWGSTWGISGHFWMPYEFICDPEYTDDFWIIENTDL